ncbi:hypothetical protein GJ744_006190 [Endocarpon pusillum]|uniref:Uncharacterized protein n=1 Tax=Endocarpon pusillum TaxID=364733 RepID=A0A8H7AK28_9EURO|nr:hypothetical protein GJ744_006190 [Endocarpon pusillum]
MLGWGRQNLLLLASVNHDGNEWTWSTADDATPHRHASCPRSPTDSHSKALAEKPGGAGSESPKQDNMLTCSIRLSGNVWRKTTPTATKPMIDAAAAGKLSITRWATRRTCLIGPT